MKALLACLLMLLPISARAQSDKIDCTSESLNQFELDQCAGRDFKAVEARLDALVRELSGKYDPANRALLEAAQKAWRAWRDLECNYETNGTAGGTINSMMNTKCRTAKANARLEELEAQLHCEEGDLTCNAPR